MIFFRIIRKLNAALILAVASSLFFLCCGESIDSENRKDLESGRIDSLTLELLPKKVRIDDFSIRVPDNFNVKKRGDDYADERGDMSISLEGANTSTVLIYRRPSEVPLDIQEFMRLIDEIDRDAYGLEIRPRSYRKTRVNDIPVLLVEGHWYDEDGDEFPLRIAGFDCGDYIYIVQSVIRGEPGDWDPLPWSITKTFRCEAD